jgi:hypothetical protein
MSHLVLDIRELSINFINNATMYTLLVQVHSAEQYRPTGEAICKNMPRDIHVIEREMGYASLTLPLKSELPPEQIFEHTVQ